jgi:hypothetical protein
MDGLPKVGRSLRFENFYNFAGQKLVEITKIIKIFMDYSG